MFVEPSVTHVSWLENRRESCFSAASTFVRTLNAIASPHPPIRSRRLLIEQLEYDPRGSSLNNSSRALKWPRGTKFRQPAGQAVTSHNHDPGYFS